jgi:hypothetical protein
MNASVVIDCASSKIHFLATAATGEFNPGIICSIEAPDHFSLFENSSPKPDLARKVANLPKI